MNQSMQLSEIGERKEEKKRQKRSNIFQPMKRTVGEKITSHNF